MTPTSTDPQPSRVVPELAIDAAAESAQIVTAIVQHLADPLDRTGCVVVLSASLESAVCAALATRAVGPEHVLALRLPDCESRPGDDAVVRRIAEQLGVELLVEDITRVLDAVGCYTRRDATIRLLVPGFTEAWRWQLQVRQEPAGSERTSFHQMVAESPDGNRVVLRVPPSEYHAIAAASAFKQRVRAMLAYYYAELRRSAVIGCLNRRQFEQGEFVRGGDGLADIEPLAHLYGSQVAQLAAELDIDAGAIASVDALDFGDFEADGELTMPLPPETFETVLNAFNRGVHHSVTAARIGYDPSRVARLYRDISRRRHATRYLHRLPLLTRDVGASGASTD